MKKLAILIIIPSLLSLNLYACGCIDTGTEEITISAVEEAIEAADKAMAMIVDEINDITEISINSEKESYKQFKELEDSKKINALSISQLVSNISPNIK